MYGEGWWDVVFCGFILVYDMCGVGVYCEVGWVRWMEVRYRGDVWEYGFLCGEDVWSWFDGVLVGGCVGWVNDMIKRYKGLINLYVS